METTKLNDNMETAEIKEQNNNRVTKIATAAVLGVALGAGTQAVAANIGGDDPIEGKINEEVTTEEPEVTTDHVETQTAQTVVENHHVEHVIEHEPEVIIIPVSSPTPSPTPSPTEPDIQFHNYGQIELGDGIVADAVSFTLNGHDGLVLDVDRDGIADGILLDRDDNGRFSEDEIRVLEPENGFSMDELRAEIDNKNTDDLPDYTKDMDDAVAVAEDEEQPSEKESEEDDVDVVDEDVIVENSNSEDTDIAVAEEVTAESTVEEPVESFNNSEMDDMPSIEDNEQTAIDDYSNSDFSAGTDVTDPDVL